MKPPLPILRRQLPQRWAPGPPRRPRGICLLSRPGPPAGSPPVSHLLPLAAPPHAPSGREFQGSRSTTHPQPCTSLQPHWTLPPPLLTPRPMSEGPFKTSNPLCRHSGDVQHRPALSSPSHPPHSSPSSSHPGPLSPEKAELCGHEGVSLKCLPPLRLLHTAPLPL